MRDPIIVGVDGSETALKAAQVARDLAVALNAPLVVISAFDNERTDVVRSTGEEFVISAASEAERVARKVVDTLRTQDLDVTHTVSLGKPAEALIKEATRLEARIIVVGNRRMRGIGRVLGSIANSVAHTASCDVYIANTYDAQ